MNSANYVSVRRNREVSQGPGHVALLDLDDGHGRSPRAGQARVAGGGIMNTEAFGGFVLLPVCYFLPTFVAAMRGKADGTGGVFFVNLLARKPDSEIFCMKRFLLIILRFSLGKQRPRVQ